MSSDTHVTESPIKRSTGDTDTFSWVFQGATTVSSPTTKVYDKGTDVTTTLAPAGSDSASGNTATSKPIIIPSNPAQKYVVELQATVDGNVEVRVLEITCRKAGAEQ